jgi:hypothetical protein
VASGVIDLAVIDGTGEGGRITSGDILHAARLMEMEQSVARIEAAQQAPLVTPAEEPNEDPVAADELDIVERPDDGPDMIEPQEDGPEVVEPREDGPNMVESQETDTSIAAAVEGQPISMDPTPWEDYNSTTDGLSESARPGADQSWGEAEAHLAAMAEEAAAQQPEQPTIIEMPPIIAEDGGPIDEVAVEEPFVETAVSVPLEEVTVSAPEQILEHSDVVEPIAAQAELEPQREVMMDFGTLELVDPESVWAEGAEDFAPWFLAHSQQLGDVLGLEAGLSDARQFTTKSATGVLGRDDNGEDVVVVSSKNAVADDSDLGHALGMAASSGAASVALVSAAIGEDQMKALSWLNNQTKSGVKWYGIEMRVVRIADSPAAMLFDLVASPPL